MLAMSELTTENLRDELAPVLADLESMKRQLDAVPLIWRSIDALQRDVRELRTAFSDFARTQVTPGEVASLQLDIDRLREAATEIQVRLVTVERLLEERKP